MSAMSRRSLIAGAAMVAATLLTVKP